MSTNFATCWSVIYKKKCIFHGFHNEKAVTNCEEKNCTLKISRVYWINIISPHHYLVSLHILAVHNTCILSFNFRFVSSLPSSFSLIPLLGFVLSEYRMIIGVITNFSISSYRSFIIVFRHSWSSLFPSSFF